MSDDIEDTGTPKDRKFVEALARGLDVLRAFTHGSVVMGNQDIARITGLPKPTVSRMTYTLTKLGYLSYSQQLEKYQLDSGVLALGYAYVSNLRVRQLAKPYMDEFARRTNTTVGLTCRDRLSMIYVENCRPAEVTTLRMDAGVRLPLATTAAGRAFLAATPEKEREHLMAALAATSTQWAMRKLGRRWQLLHRAIYLIGLLAILHYWWHKAGKNDFEQPLIYGAVLAVLLGWRVVARLRRDGAG